MYDIIIIGSGSAGLPAAIYASRYCLKTLVIGEMPGGALATAHRVENWPGTMADSGRNIMESFRAHAKAYGSEICEDRVVSIEGEAPCFTLKTLSGKEFQTKTVLLATGNKYRHLRVPGEDKFLGSGVSYCATCDGNFFKNLDVAVVGGGDSAATEALYLAGIAKTVYLIVRKDRMKAEEVWMRKVVETPNIIIRYESVIEEIIGKFEVEKVRFVGGEELDLQGVFVAIGSYPDASLLTPYAVDLDTDGCVKVDAAQHSSVRGIYAAGDVTTNSNKYKQAIISAAE